MESNLLHLIAIAVAGVGFPVYAMMTGNKIRQTLLENPEKRTGIYRSTSIWLLCMAALVLISTIIGKDDLGEIGLSFLDQPLWVILLFAVSFAGLFLFRKMKIPQEKLEDIQRQYKEVRYLLPATRREYRYCIVTAFFAGICEEIVFRGFLFWQFDQWMPAGLAIIAVNLLFAIGHAGTTFKNAISTFVLGIFWSVSFLITGSIWIAILTHILIDLYAGTLGYKLNQGITYSGGTVPQPHTGHS